MTNNQVLEDRLSSWKEISVYLKCDVRTCRRWEVTKALPIHRIGESEKARVYAYCHELDIWLKRQAKKNNAAWRSWLKPGKPKFLGLITSLILILFCSIVLIRWITFDKNPYDFRIEHSLLIVTNESGSKLWEYDTGIEDLSTDEHYHEAGFHKRKNGNGIDFPLLIIKDLHSDGKKEVLFSIQTRLEHREGLLLCLDHHGKELWRFQGSRELEFGGKVYSGDYRIKGLDTYDIDLDGLQEILVFSIQNPDWPCQLAVLDARGKIRGEYWNAGYFQDFVLHDLDGDGKKELILSGVNNEYGKGFLTVLDPVNIRGQSPHSGEDFACSELGPGSHLDYILFPRTAVRREYPIDGVLEIALLSNGRLSLTTQLSGLIFELNPDLSVYDITFTNTYKEKHNAARRAGETDIEMNDTYRQQLIKGVLYWENGEWTKATSSTK
jgi:hypothetical protein